MYAKPWRGQVRGPHTWHTLETEKSLVLQLKRKDERGCEQSCGGREKQDWLIQSFEVCVKSLLFYPEKKWEPLEDFK